VPSSGKEDSICTPVHGLTPKIQLQDYEDGGQNAGLYGGIGSISNQEDCVTILQDASQNKAHIVSEYIEKPHQVHNLGQ